MYKGLRKKKNSGETFGTFGYSAGAMNGHSDITACSNRSMNDECKIKTDQTFAGSVSQVCTI